MFARRSEQNDNPVEQFFANILGVPEADLQASAVALIGEARCAGIGGLEGVTGSGDISTDSYRSEDGAYVGPTLASDRTAGFYGAVVAPETDIILAGTGSCFDNIRGRTVIADGATNVHVDESLLASLFDVDSVFPILVQ